jgi:hypothetical protein
MEHLVEITVFLASISAILLVSGLIIVKTNFHLSSKSAESDKKITFWFQRNELKQSTDAAHNMLRDLKLADGLTDLLAFFEPRFPGATSLAGGKDSINELGSFWKHDQAILRITKKHEDVQIELIDSTTVSNIYTLRRAKHELEMVQNVVENTPFPVWQIAESGNVMMSNAAFRELGSNLRKQLIHFATSSNIHVERVKFEVETNKPPHWFDMNKFSLPKSSVQYALDVTEIIRAQQAQKNFVQTLSHAFHRSGDF